MMFNKATFTSLISTTLLFLSSQNLQSATLVGSTPTQFDVSSGTANYSIPIRVVPGRGGMQPDLSLSYSSGGGGSTLGAGWGLGGLSAISRCPKTLEQDGIVGSINFDTDDRYCLDGQRLIPVSGANGGVGTEYRTEIDSYSKITSVGGSTNNPSTFVVKTKAGQTITYGGSGNASLSFPQGRLSWSIRQMSDTTNNTITYNYSLIENTQYLSSINYTGGSVTFIYITNSNSVWNYFKGSAIKQSRLLSRVNISSPSGIFKSYRFSYQNVNNNTQVRMPQLLSVQECDEASNCFKPVTFSWSVN